MKFSIKQAGVMFAILAIFVLALAGVFCGVNFSDSAKIGVNASGNVEPVAEQTPDVVLQGSYAEMVTKWNNAIQLSKNEYREVFVQLGQNWRAKLTDNLGAFGEGVGFKDGSIFVPSGTTIKLDLNGYEIDRYNNFLTNSSADRAQKNGGVIFVEGSFTLKDSAFESMRDQIYADYYNNSIKDVKYFLDLPIGRIQGGCSMNDGGGIYAASSANSLIIESGMICLNKATSGGGLCSTARKIIIKDGIFAANVANKEAGGIFINGDFDFQGGIVYGNKIICEGEYSSGSGIGLYVLNISNSNISDVIFAKNEGSAMFTRVNGGAMYIRGRTSSTITIKNTRIENNVINGNGGGIYIFKANVTLTNVDIINNTAGEFGGGINIAEMENNNLTVSNTTIKGNHALSSGGGINNCLNCNLNFGENNQIYDNYHTGSISDNLWLADGKITITENLGNSRIGICGNLTTFTSGYSTHNAGVAPSNYFFNDNEGDIVCLNSAGEVQFSKSIKSNVYDFVYLENNIRKSYKDNGIMHGNNDFEIIQALNSGKLVLGKIVPNTSVNEFIGNLDYGNAKLKLLNNNGNIVYGEGADSKYAGLLSNKLELSVGTGWRLQVYSLDNALIDDMYLSVLGDLTGDGKTNSLDLTFLKKVINDKTLYEVLSDKPYLQLATLLINNGKFTNADGEILWNIVCGRMSITDFI